MLDVQEKTWIVGVLNITPDSFSDGGRFLDPGLAIDQAKRMVEEGADILELGGESTRPGAVPVSVDEELRRIIPVLRDLRSKLVIPLAVDTYKSDVARVVLEEGAEIINDIYGVREEGRLAAVVAEKQAGLVIMHMKGTPQDMQIEPRYNDVVARSRPSWRIASPLPNVWAFILSQSLSILDWALGSGRRTISPYSDTWRSFIVSRSRLWSVHRASRLSATC